MAKSKPRNNSGRRTVRTSSKKGSLFKKYRLFSPLTLITVAVVVVLAAIVSQYKTNGDSSASALGLTTLGSTQTGLAGRASAGINLNNVAVGKLTLIGSNLGGARYLQIGNSRVPVTATTNTTATANIPSSALDCASKPTAACNPNISGTSRQCTPGTASCRTVQTNGQVTTTAVDSAGNQVGQVNDISSGQAPPVVTDVTVSGNSAVVDGLNLHPGDKMTVGRSIGTLTFLGNNTDGTSSFSVGVNTQSCLFDAIPLLNRLCTNARSGSNQVSATSNGQTSNSFSVNLGTTAAAGQAGQVGALGNNGQHTSSSGGNICTPSFCSNSKGQQSGTCVGTSFNGSQSKYMNAPLNGNVKVTKPTSSDVWNYGSNFTFEWVNPGSQITPNASSPLPKTGAFAQVTLLGGCMRYSVQYYLEPNAPVATHDPDHDAKWSCNGGSLACAWVENENGAPGCGTSNDGTDPKTCDTDDGSNDPGGSFRAWSLETDTSQQEGASSGMLCFGVMQSGGRYNDSNVGVSGAIVSVTVPSCVFGKPPSGTYTAWVQVFGLSGPDACTPGKRCVGLPTRIGQAADGVSQPFQLNSN